MAKKAGRPLGSKNKRGHDEKEFLKSLLSDTASQYRAAFVDMANAAVPRSKGYDKVKAARFIKVRAEISKMIVPKPVEIDANIQSSDWETLMSICNKWDDEPDE